MPGPPQQPSSTESTPMGDLVRTGSRYTDEDRRNAVTEYALKGSIQAVSRSTGIPRTTIIGWKNSDWWETETNAVRAATDDHIMASYERILQKAAAETLDRLENGDHHLGKDGKIIRVPVRARDLTIVHGTAFDKRALVLNRPTTISAANPDAIKKLVKQFEDLADRHNERIIEGEVLDSNNA